MRGGPVVVMTLGPADVTIVVDVCAGFDSAEMPRRKARPEPVRCFSNRKALRSSGNSIDMRRFPHSKGHGRNRRSHVQILAAALDAAEREVHEMSEPLATGNSPAAGEHTKEAFCTEASETTARITRWRSRGVSQPSDAVTSAGERQALAIDIGPLEDRTLLTGPDLRYSVRESTRNAPAADPRSSP